MRVRMRMRELTELDCKRTCGFESPLQRVEGDPGRVLRRGRGDGVRNLGAGVCLQALEMHAPLSIGNACKHSVRHSGAAFQQSSYLLSVAAMLPPPPCLR